MEIDGFNNIMTTVGLAKELYEMGRFEVVKTYFLDELCYDSYFENMMTATYSIFSNFDSNYSDENEIECMTFSDDVITEYYRLAGEYGRKHKIYHNDNQYVELANLQVKHFLNFSYSMDFKLLGYTKNNKASKKSKLLVFTYAYDFCEHDALAFALLKIYKWFKFMCNGFYKGDSADKSIYNNHIDTTNKEAIAA